MLVSKEVIWCSFLGKGKSVIVCFYVVDCWFRLFNRLGRLLSNNGR